MFVWAAKQGGSTAEWAGGDPGGVEEDQERGGERDEACRACCGDAVKVLVGLRRLSSVMLMSDFEMSQILFVEVNPVVTVVILGARLDRWLIVMNVVAEKRGGCTRK